MSLKKENCIITINQLSLSQDLLVNENQSWTNVPAQLSPEIKKNKITTGHTVCVRNRLKINRDHYEKKVIK